MQKYMPKIYAKIAGKSTAAQCVGSPEMYT